MARLAANAVGGGATVLRPGEEAVASGGRRRDVWGYTAMLMTLYLINWADKSVLGLAAQPLKEEMGLTATQIGMVGSAFFIAFTIGGFAAGPMHRVASLRWVIAVLAFVWAAAMLPLVVWSTFGVLLVSRIVLGAAEGPSAALVYTALYTWHPAERRGLPSALINGSASFAKIAIAPLLAVLIAAAGWRVAFVVLSVVGLAWVAAWLWSWREGPFGPTSSTSTDELEVPVGVRPDEPAVPWRRILWSRTFVSGAVAVIAMYGIVSAVLTWLPSYFEKGLGFDRVTAGVLFGLPSLGSLVVSLIVSSVGDRALRRGASARLVRGIVPSVGVVLCGLGFVLLPLVGPAHPWLGVALVTVGYAFGPTVFPLFNAGLSQIAPPRQLSGALGVFIALQSLGGVAAPYVTGVIVDAAPTPADGYAQAFQVFGALAVVGALVSLAWFDPERDRARLIASRDAAD